MVAFEIAWVSSKWSITGLMSIGRVLALDSEWNRSRRMRLKTGQLFNYTSRFGEAQEDRLSMLACERARTRGTLSA
jgi:hypothetical protein